MIKAAFNSSPSNGSTPSNGNTPAIGNTPSPAAEQKMYGYIRVSTREQNEARQLIALHDFGIPEECVFMDKQSGKDFNRPAYRKLIKSQLNRIPHIGA